MEKTLLAPKWNQMQGFIWIHHIPFFVVEIHQFWEVQISISYHPMTSIAYLNSGEGAPLVVRSLRAPTVRGIFLFGCVFG